MKKLLLSVMLLSFQILNAQQYVSNPFFGNNGIVASGIAYGGETMEMLIQPDGKIINCGYTYSSACNCFHITMFRVDACGALDSTFGTNGMVHHTFDQRNSGYDYHLQPDGKIMVVGTQAISNGSGDQKPFIARFLNNGQPDTTFGTMGSNKVVGYPTYNSFTYVLPLDSGKYLAQNGTVIMRFDSLGAIDASFGSNGIISHTFPAYVVFAYSARSVQRSDKKIISVASGACGSPNGITPVFMCTDTLGQLDSTFGTNGFAADFNIGSSGGTPFYLVLQSDDKVLAMLQNTTESEIKVARYNTNGSLDTTYGTGGYVSFAQPGQVRFQYAAILSNDDLLVLVTVFGQKLFTINSSGAVTNSVTVNGSTNFTIANGSDPQVMNVLNDNEFYFSSQSGGTGAPFYIMHTTTTPAPAITQNFTLLSANYNQSGATYQWYLNGNIISGATDSVYTFTQNGVYSVEVITASGCDYTYNYTVTNTGIDNDESLSEITASPNPFNDVITISNTQQKNVSITLTDVTGNIIESHNTSNEQHKLKLNQLAGGIYLLSIQSGSDVKRIKLVKQ